jgi:tol-pal system protein YbgF
LRTRWFAFALAAILFGALGGVILTPQPAGAVSKEMIELQQQVTQLLQGQQDLRSTIDANNASLKTLIQQSLDSVNRVNSEMGVLQKTVQEVQANTGARLDATTQQTQGLSDNLQDVQARVGKLSQQLTDVQSTLQSIDAKISNGAPSPSGGSSAPMGATPSPNGSEAGSGNSAGSPAGGQPVSGMPPISADTLYLNALRDFTTGKYDLSRQEFSDYTKNFPANDLAGNAQFYLGEIDYAQGQFPDAINQYDNVLANYPKSFKLAASLLKKGMAELELGKKTAATRDLRDVVRRFPGSDESRRAAAKLHDLGIPAKPATR